jgi:hypothetical protein
VPPLPTLAVNSAASPSGSVDLTRMVLSGRRWLGSAAVEASDADRDILEPNGFQGWAPTYGRWDLSDEVARYVPPSDDEAAVGLLLGPQDFSVGLLEATVRFPPEQAEPLPQGRIVFGYDARTEAHYSAGLGGFNAQYLLEQFVPCRGFIALRHSGGPGKTRARARL